MSTKRRNEMYVRVSTLDYKTLLFVSKKPIRTQFFLSKDVHGVRRVDEWLHPEIRNTGIYNSSPRRNRLMQSLKGKKWIKWANFPSYAKDTVR